MDEYKTIDDHYVKTEVTRDGDVISMPRKLSSHDELYDIMVSIDREPNKRMAERNGIDQIIGCYI